MKNILRKLSVYAVALPFLVLGTSAQAAMTGAQIKAAASGKTFAYSGKYSGTMGISSNGSAWLKASNGKKKSGKWWISGNKFCRQWKGESAGCRTWTSLSGGKYRTSNGYTLTVK